MSIENVGNGYADMSAAQTQTQAQTSVMREAIDTVEMQGEAAVQLIQGASEMTSTQSITDPALGQQVDVTA